LPEKKEANMVYETGSGSLIRSLGYEYDAVGMITEKKIVDDASSFVCYNYLYDSLDRLVHESSAAGFQLATAAVYSCNLAGNRTSKTSNGWKTTYTLGDGNHLASTSAQAATNTLFVAGTANEPIGTNPLWGEIWITNWTSGASSIPSVNGNTFFAEVPAFGDQTNTLHVAIPDKAGNMGYAVKDYWVGSTTNGTNETKTYQYDEAGNTTNLNGVSLSWDERYRLTSVTTATAVVSYEYDVLNRRVSRIESEISNPSSAITNWFVYNGNQVIADLDGSGNLLRTYVWGAGIDNLLSMTVYGATATNTYYAIKDHQNTVIALVDASGSVVESYEYDAYGNILDVKDASGNSIANHQSAIGNRYTFQGREIDWTTGLYYFRARWYNPETGRWLSKDPIGIAGGLNLYAFCGNNPVNFVDPMGLVSLDEVSYSGSTEFQSRAQGAMANLYENSSMARSLIMNAESITIIGSNDPRAGNAGDGNGYIRLHETDPSGLGPEHPARAYPNEFPSSHFLEIVLGHELGHAVLGLSDPANVRLIENVIRAQMGVELRETYHGKSINCQE